MVYERLTYQILPYEILYQVKDHFDKWPTSWKLLRAFNTEDDRDEAYCKLEPTSFRQYKRHDKASELEAMERAEKRGKPQKLEEPELPLISPADDVVTLSAPPMTATEALARRQDFEARLRAIEESFFAFLATDKMREIL